MVLHITLTVMSPPRCGSDDPCISAALHARTLLQSVLFRRIAANGLCVADISICLDSLDLGSAPNLISRATLPLFSAGKRKDA